MKIKDVEKLTGLSQRSIRLYEEKGLIDVELSDDNRYRSYSEENLERLKLIRVLRYFDFSIEEIGEILEKYSRESLLKALSGKSEEYIDEADSYELRARECRALIKDIEKSEGNGDDGDKVDANILDDYIEMIGDLDEEGDREVQELIKELEHPSLGETILWTIICSGPLLWGLIRGAESKVHVILIAIMTVFITLNWTAYFRRRSRRNDYQKKRDKGSLWVLAAIPICTLLALLAFSVIDTFREYYLSHMLNGKWIFFEGGMRAEYLLVVGIMIPLIAFAFRVLHKATGNDIYDSSLVFAFIRKHKVLTMIASLLLLYTGTFGMNVNTEDSIVCYDAFHPAGVRYTYGEIESVETGIDSRGDFYYKLNITADGRNKTVKLGSSTVNEKYYPEWEEDATYAEYVDFDSKLMSLGIPKTADVESLERCDYNEECMENFRKIITNK